MSASGPAGAMPELEALLADGDRKECCAALYTHPAVRWLLGDELHPGGAATTRRALELADVGADDRLLDVASGTGTSALLAARELGCEVVGVEYARGAVEAAREAAAAEGLAGRVSFERGDAEGLAFADASFDAVLCECSLCTFGDKPRALAEIARVLRPGGRLALSDVVVDRERLPPGFDGTLAAIACVGEAMPREGYERLLTDAGMRPDGFESRAADAAALAERVHDRLRGARLLGGAALRDSPLSPERSIELGAGAREAIAGGALGYAIFVATA